MEPRVTREPGETDGSQHPFIDNGSRREYKESETSNNRIFGGKGPTIGLVSVIG